MSKLLLLLLTLGLSVPSLGRAEAVAGPPVLIGFDAEAGHRTSTSDDAIRMGINIAMSEINAAGGVLGGRPLQLVEKDNRSVPARGVANLKEFAAMPDLVGVFCGKFSPVVLEALPTIHAQQLLLLDPWAAADGITDNSYRPSYVFRLSLRDSWAQQAMLDEAARRGTRKLALLLPNTAWGRSNLKAAEEHVASRPELVLSSVLWFNWGEKSLLGLYEQALAGGAELLVLVANEREGSLLAREVAGLPVEKRLPILAAWGITGGDFAAMVGPQLADVDLQVVQTYSFVGDQSPAARRVLAALRREYGIAGPEQLLSPVGVAHAYDLTHLLAQAIDRAGSTERPRVRAALEQLPSHEGLVRRYAPPFTAARHDALGRDNVIFCRFAANGSLVPLSTP